MKHLLKTKWITLFAVMLLATVFFISTPQNANGELAILSVSHTPTTVSKDTVVTVEITFNDDTNVSGIQIQYCSLEPEFLCHFPKIAMTSETANTWNGSFTVIEEGGTIGYALYILLLNGTTIHAPDSIDYLSHTNVAEPNTGNFYFTIDLTEITPTNSAPLSFGLCELAITFSAVVLTRTMIGKRRKNV